MRANMACIGEIIQEERYESNRSLCFNTRRQFEQVGAENS